MELRERFLNIFRLTSYLVPDDTASAAWDNYISKTTSIGVSEAIALSNIAFLSPSSHDYALSLATLAEEESFCNGFFVAQHLDKNRKVALCFLLATAASKPYSAEAAFALIMLVLRSVSIDDIKLQSALSQIEQNLTELAVRRETSIRQFLAAMVDAPTKPTDNTSYALALGGTIALLEQDKNQSDQLIGCIAEPNATITSFVQLVVAFADACHILPISSAYERILSAISRFVDFPSPAAVPSHAVANRNARIKLSEHLMPVYSSILKGESIHSSAHDFARTLYLELVAQRIVDGNLK